MNITYGSVCSGIESASAAWEPLGMAADWFSEIEPFPCVVLKHHWPDVPNLGDMTLLPELVRMGLVSAPDILVGGTPCQAFSVAGNRESLDDERGQLTLTYVDLANAIDEQRETNDECIVNWENVPGVLNTADNAFGCFLGELAGSGCELFPSTDKPISGKSNKLWRWCKKTKQHRAKWSNAGCVFGPKRTVAWRVIDAQYFGVPQRRRRVFVVASSRDGFDPCKVLFEFEGVRRDIAPSRETREELAKCLGASANLSHREDADTLVVHGTQDLCVNNNLSHPVGRNNGAENVIVNDIAKCLTRRSAGAANLDYEVSRFIVQPIHDKTTRHAGQTGKGSGNGFGVGKESDPMFTLTTGDKHAVYAFQPRIARNGRGDMGDLVHALNAQSGATGKGDSAPCVSIHQNSRNELRENEIAGALSTGGGKPGQGYAATRSMNEVRRLTPIECERLQGFPDNHTQIPYRNKSVEDCPDGPRYKAIGNSKAVPCIQFIGVRIMLELQGLL